MCNLHSTNPNTSIFQTTRQRFYTSYEWHKLGIYWGDHKYCHRSSNWISSWNPSDFKIPTIYKAHLQITQEDLYGDY